MGPPQEQITESAPSEPAISDFALTPLRSCEASGLSPAIEEVDLGVEDHRPMWSCWSSWNPVIIGSLVFGRPELMKAGDLLQQRIHRVLAIARAYGYPALVLGAWGCGAFGNDPRRTAIDFRHALEQEHSGAFSEVVFAIADWSPERRFLGPFRDAFAT